MKSLTYSVFCYLSNRDGESASNSFYNISAPLKLWGQIVFCLCGSEGSTYFGSEHDTLMWIGQGWVRNTRVSDRFANILLQEKAQYLRSRCNV